MPLSLRLRSSCLYKCRSNEKHVSFAFSKVSFNFFFLFIWAISASLDAYGAKVAEGCQNTLP